MKKKISECSVKVVGINPARDVSCHKAGVRSYWVAPFGSDLSPLYVKVALIVYKVRRRSNIIFIIKFIKDDKTIIKKEVKKDEKNV